MFVVKLKYAHKNSVSVVVISVKKKKKRSETVGVTETIENKTTRNVIRSTTTTMDEIYGDKRKRRAQINIEDIYIPQPLYTRRVRLKVNF